MELASAPTERNTLACLLKSRDAWLSVADLLTIEDFTFDLNVALFRVICALYEQKLALDPVLLSSRLGQDSWKELEGLGGWDYILNLQALPIQPSNISGLATELRALTLRRRTQVAGEKISALATEEKDVERMLGKTQIEVDKIAADQDEGTRKIGEGLALQVQRKIESTNLIPGLKSGFHRLDEAIQGFQDGELYVTGGRLKIGKSILLLAWAKHLAVDQGVPVVWVSTEHSLRLEQMRLLSMVSEVPFLSLNSGQFREFPPQMERAKEGVDTLEKAPLFFKSLPGFTLEKLRRITRKHVRLDGAKVLFFDYIKSPPDTSAFKAEWQQLGEFAYGLKQLAGEEEIPIVTGVQINREGSLAQRAHQDLDADYFSGSDRIAQAMTVGLTIRKPFQRELQEFSGRTDEGTRMLQIAANRLGGSSYKSILQFEPSILRLQELQRVA